LSLQGFRKTEEVSEVESTETGPTKLQELPFRQMRLSDALTLPASSHIEEECVICEGFIHMIYSLKNGLNIDNFVKSRESLENVIAAKAGIQ